MAQSRSGKGWRQRHAADPYVKRSRQQGYRSRASYKLLEIHRREQLIRSGMTVLDLGAAPGGWSQVAAQLVGRHGRVIATDLLTMEPLYAVQFIQGDLTDREVRQQILAATGEAGVDLVISDLAPNISGVRAIDQPKALHLAELALELTRTLAVPRACFLVKLFQGAGFDEFRRKLQTSFGTVKAIKPPASRSRSREIYLLGSDYRAA